MGLAVERGNLRQRRLQDSRVWGQPSPAAIDWTSTLPTTSFYQAYLEVHTSDGSTALVRVGRQEMAWGEGRLFGTSDWSPAPRSLDAVRGRWTVGAWDFDAFASMLTSPGLAPSQPSHGRTPNGSGTGTQLFGPTRRFTIAPLLQTELTGLARIAGTPCR